MMSDTKRKLQKTRYSALSTKNKSKSNIFHLMRTSHLSAIFTKHICAVDDLYTIDSKGT